MRQLIAANWKMHGLQADLAEVDALAAHLIAEGDAPRADMLLCPPATLLRSCVERAAGSPLILGGQDCHPLEQGAYTGDISAQMLADAGAKYVIVGHSERRSEHRETSTYVSTKARAAHEAGLVPVICLGETSAQRESGDVVAVITGKLQRSIPEAIRQSYFVIAYEPYWAIGSGTPATPEQIEEAHALLRERLILICGESARACPILYGGSVKPGNAGDILSIPEVGGVLVGGASLKAESFLAIYDQSVAG